MMGMKLTPNMSVDTKLIFIYLANKEIVVDQNNFDLD